MIAKRELVYNSTHTNSALGAELSTSTVTVPVTGASVSTVTRQPSGGRATAAGKPLAATTWTRTTAIDGKTSCLQKSKCQLVAALCPPARRRQRLCGSLLHNTPAGLRS